MLHAAGGSLWEGGTALAAFARSRGRGSVTLTAQHRPSSGDGGGSGVGRFSLASASNSAMLRLSRPPSTVDAAACTSSTNRCSRRPAIPGAAKLRPICWSRSIHSLIFCGICRPGRVDHRAPGRGWLRRENSHSPAAKIASVVAQGGELRPLLAP